MSMTAEKKTFLAFSRITTISAVIVSMFRVISFMRFSS